jgi:DNA-binding transcriptional MerR regulator
MQFVPKKLYYKIREVSKIIGVEAHVLRFWETEFPALSPPKSKSGQRTYRPKDIELLLRIRKLLYEDGFTIAGARKKLNQGATIASKADDSAEASTSDPVVAAPVIATPEQTPAPASENLKKVKAELENILTLLERG